MATVMDNQNWDTLIEVIRRSYTIKKHIDFFSWQQNYLSSIFPHDVLIAVWGDFNNNQLSYDISSKIPGIRTQALQKSPGRMDSLMADLYHKWLTNGEKWYRINNFVTDSDTYTFPVFLNNKLSDMQSLLVYGVRDERGDNDCLYVFMDQSKEFPVTPPILGMLMPHLDTALRRIENIEGKNDDELQEEHLQGISDREQEIIHWLRLGKTNFEISIILGISTNTVKNHLKRIFKKLDVSSRAQAVATCFPSKLN